MIVGATDYPYRSAPSIKAGPADRNRVHTSVDRLIDRFHLGLLNVASWALPVALVVDIVGEWVFGDRSFRWHWFVYPGLWCVVRWQLRRQRPDATPLVVAVGVFLLISIIAQSVTATRLGAPDSTTTVTILVTLGLYLTLTGERYRRHFGAAYAVTAGSGAALTAFNDGLRPEAIALRSAVVGGIVFLGSLALVRLKGDLVAALLQEEASNREQQRAITRSGALADFSDILLRSSGESLEEALGVLRTRLGLDLIEVHRYETGATESSPPSPTPGIPRDYVVAGKIELRGKIHGRLAAFGSPGSLEGIIPVLATASGMIGSHWEREEVMGQLRKLVQSKDELVASVSHELRTPLTGILGFAETLSDMEEAGAGELGEFIHLIADQSRDMSDIIEDLLAAARADIGTLTVQCREIDLSGEVLSILEMSRIQTLAASKDIEVEFDELSAIGDPLRCRQIVRNLLTNAFRYGGDRVQVRMVRTDTSSRVEVADNGPGLDPEEEARIFEPYYRARQVPTQPGSVGLGLAVSRQLARLMEGDVTVRREDDWTIFTLELPARSADSKSAVA